MTEDLARRVLEGDRRVLPRLFSLLERGVSNLSEIMKALYPHTGKAYCVGVTGPPGAGKSTLVDGLVGLYRRAGATVGVLAVDPTSPFTGGAVLGDRVRMRQHYLDEGVFIRSLATRGVHGGLSPTVMAGIRLLDAFGVDVVIVESVGVGQTELDIVSVADTVVVVLVPEAGDAVQMLKAGLMEIGDVFVVNKADRPGADQLAAVIGTEVTHTDPAAWWIPPIVMTQADRSSGIDDLFGLIGDHRERAESTCNLEHRRTERRRMEFARVLQGELEQRLSEESRDGSAVGALLELVDGGKVDPYSAAYTLLQRDNLLDGLVDTTGGPSISGPQGQENR